MCVCVTINIRTFVKQQVIVFSFICIFLAVSKPLVTVTATVTVRSANFRLASIREDRLQ